MLSERECLVAEAPGVQNPYTQAINRLLAVMSIGLDGTVLDASSRFYELSGYAEAEIKGKSAFDFFLPGDYYEFNPETAHHFLLCGKDLSCRAVFLSKSREIPVRLLVSPVDLDGIAGHDAYVAMLQDITQEQQADAMRSALAEAAAKQAVLAGAIHNIGNMITVVAGQARSMQLESDSVSDAVDSAIDHAKSLSENEKTEFLGSAMHVIAETLSGLRDISKTLAHATRDISGVVLSTKQHFPGQRVVFERINVAKLIREMVNTLSRANPEVRFVTHGMSDAGGVYAETARFYLIQIIQNLLTNSVDAIAELHAPMCFTGRIDVYLTTSNDTITLRVVDNGIGIPDYIDVFQKGETSKALGTGTGLADSLWRAQEMGGVLRRCPTQSGAAFELEFPIDCRKQS